MVYECSPLVPSDRLIERGDFVDYFGHAEDFSRINIEEVISTISGLMCNDAAVCGGRRSMKIWMLDLSEMWKDLNSKYDIIFEVPLVCWDCSGT